MQEGWTAEDYCRHVLSAAASWAQWIGATGHYLMVGQASMIDVSIEEVKKFLREQHNFDLPEGRQDIGALSEKPTGAVE